VYITEYALSIEIEPQKDQTSTPVDPILCLQDSDYVIMFLAQNGI
jgi:hypothetical protein